MMYQNKNQQQSTEIKKEIKKSFEKYGDDKSFRVGSFY